MKLKGQLITGSVMEQVRENSRITVQDFIWILGIYSATYTRMTTKAANEPLDHVHAGLIRYVAAHWPDIPAQSLFTDISPDTTRVLIKKIRNAYDHLEPIKLGNSFVDLSEYGGLGTILFRSYSSARHYDLATTDMTVAVERWAKIVLYCFENGLEKRIVNILTDEAKANGKDPESLLHRGW